LAGFLFAGEETREKRAFFPEDIVDSKFVFHSCLLSIFWSRRARFTELISKLMDSILTKNPFIHIRDEGSFDSAQDSPRYHPDSSLVSCLIVCFDEGLADERPADALKCYNGLSREWLLAISPFQFSSE
jgi:hypothetical protein